ncbi:MAG: hypothetical protein GY805_05305 [Chloroflexi bacterium]|nr:hypothetical protein [Chloroflexota bacterium]
MYNPLHIRLTWSYFALGRHLDNTHQWVSLAIGIALIAAAVDLVGVLVNMTVLPELANALLSASSGQELTLQAIFQSMESLTNALTNVAAFGLYSFAGLLLLPAAFARLAWLGVTEWGIAAVATVLLLSRAQFSDWAFAD